MRQQVEDREGFGTAEFPQQRQHRVGPPARRQTIGKDQHHPVFTHGRGKVLEPDPARLGVVGAQQP
ncbi:hypothetical protein ACFQ51_19390 [Streptomyces kaempferi]